VITSGLKKFFSFFGLEVKRKKVIELKEWSYFAEIDPKGFFEIYNNNRSALSKVDYWLNDDILGKSVWGYGNPFKDPYHVNYIKYHITYSDLIVFLSTFLKTKVSYLEIGVSFGKNLFQLSDSFNESTLVGIEIESLNPVLDKFYNSKEVLASRKPESIEAMDKTLKVHHPEFAKYKYNTNTIYYLADNLLNPRIWDNLSSFKFNLIFSDAWHSPEALEHEIDMLIKNNLIDEQGFIMIWDDLGGDMTDKFFELTSKLISHYKLNSYERFITDVNGMIGYAAHPIGIFSSLKISRKA
jgi:hypothetical protein